MSDHAGKTFFQEAVWRVTGTFTANRNGRAGCSLFALVFTPSIRPSACGRRVAKTRGPECVTVLSCPYPTPQDGQGNGLKTGSDIQSIADFCDVIIDSSPRDIQDYADVGGALSSSDPFEALDLPRC